MKAYKFKEKEDYIFYLSEIVSDTAKYKDKLQRYLGEIDQILESKPNAEKVETVFYEAISDKINANFLYIFNLLGDESKSAISYRKFRKLLVKGHPCLNATFDKLTNEEARVSNEFNQHRNWGLHIPESLLTNKRKILKIDSDLIAKYKESVRLEVYEYFDIEYLTALREQTDDVIQNIEILEWRMKDDYSKLAETGYSLSLVRFKVKPYEIMDIVQASLNTQVGKNT
jgi:hypothetical protein